MQSINKIFFILLIVSTMQVNAAPLIPDSLHFEVLLNSKMLKKINLNEKFINAFDITSDRLILLSTAHQYYALGWGGIKPIGKSVIGNISNYAFTANNLLMTIRSNELCAFDSIGNLSMLIKLPSAGMGITAGKYAMYVYDRNKNQQKHALYAIVKGGKYAKLVEVPAPIISVVEMNNSILFATENGMFSYNLKSKDLKAFVALPKDKKIISIAVDTFMKRVYFSTENSVYSLKDTSIIIITDKLGGVLKYFNGGLIVFNPEKKLLIRILGLESRIEIAKPSVKAVPITPPPPPPHTDTVVVAPVVENKVPPVSPPVQPPVDSSTINTAQGKQVSLTQPTTPPHTDSTAMNPVKDNKAPTPVNTEGGIVKPKTDSTANTSNKTTVATNENKEILPKKEEVTFNDLPNAITDFIFGIKKSYKITDHNGVVTYEIHHTTNGVEMIDILDAKGNFLRSGQ